MSHEQPPMTEDPKLNQGEIEQISSDVAEIVHSVEDLAPIEEGSEVTVLDPTTQKRVVWGVAAIKGTAERPTMLRLMRMDLESGMPESRDITDAEEIKKIQKLNMGFWRPKSRGGTAS